MVVCVGGRGRGGEVLDVDLIVSVPEFSYLLCCLDEILIQ